MALMQSDKNSTVTLLIHHWLLCLKCI